MYKTIIMAKKSENKESKVLKLTKPTTRKKVKKVDSSVKVEIINKSDNPLPKRATVGSVGLDVMAAVGDTIIPGETKMIHTGLFMSIPFGYEIQVRPRSGLAFKHSIQVSNSPGTIDSDYRGECNVLLTNFSNKAFKVYRGDRIGQFVLSVKPTLEWVEVKTLSDTARGEGGFGHTGE